jgi:hypothetical protein
MSRIRTLVDLQDAMQKEFAWRKKELHGLKSLVIANENTHNRDLFIRAAVALLYAHWEGFIKEIGRTYLDFVAEKKLRYDELPPHFLAMAIGRLVKDAGATSKIQPSIELVEFFQSHMGERSHLSAGAGIVTKSNLRSDVLHEIVRTLGLDYSRFATKEKLLDEKLLGNRNQIAHGQYVLVKYDEYLNLHGEVMGMMQDFYNQIDNMANSGTYKR